jgi:hypothetical protein
MSNKSFEDIYQELQEERSKNHSMKITIEEQSHRLRGISLLVRALTSTRDYTDEEAINSAYDLVSDGIDSAIKSLGY